MTRPLIDALTRQIKQIHRNTLVVTGDLTDEQLALQPGIKAPPIGWHLWHVGRWSDRLQASLASRFSAPDLHPAERWVVEDLAASWGLTSADLGWLQSGIGMEIETAIIVAQLGSDVLGAYARQSFAAVEAAVGSLEDSDLLQKRPQFYPQLLVTEDGAYQSGRHEQSSMLDDIHYHLVHNARHLGMIEALRGALFGLAGSATV